MNRFLSGKINKELFVLILIFVPMIAAALIFSCDYGLSAVISIICLIFFMKKMKKGALEFQISQISKTKISTSGLLIALAVMIQILLFTFVYRTGNLFVKEDWNKYIDIIKPILVAPVVEELFFRWASTEICIDKDTSKGRCALFLVVMLIIWTLAHGVLNINLGVTFIGAILYYIYFKTKNILHCILFHSATNISYVVLLSSFQNKVRFLFEKNLFLILVCILVVLESIYLMFRLKSETKNEKCEI